MEKEIIYEGESFGYIQIEKNGIYYHVKAKCPFRTGIYRLYMISNGETVRLGVLFPEKDVLTLSRQVPAHEIGPDPENGKFILMPGAQLPQEKEEKIAPPAQSVLNLPQEDTAAPDDMDGNTYENEKPPETNEFPGAVIDRWSECSDASSFTSDEVLKPRLFSLSGVLYRYRAGGVELAVPAESAEAVNAVLALTRAEHIRGRDYFIISLDRDGFPSPAMYSSSL